MDNLIRELFNNVPKRKTVPLSVRQYDAMILWYKTTDVKHEALDALELDVQQRTDEHLKRAHMELAQAIGAFQSEVESYCERIGVATDDPRWDEAEKMSRST